jgi:sterol desaturase/sphingolipid hydroxylase (fatty acid hydroxylase superfamily)
MMHRAKLSVPVGALAIAGTLAALFWLERRYPLRHAKPQPDRERVPRNLAMAALTAGVVRLCERPLVEPLAKTVDRNQIGLLPVLKLRPTTEKVLGVVLMDYGLYWWHILLHRIPFLWRTHLAHHTDLVLDTSTALRFHWLEFLLSVPYRLGQVGILGIRPDALKLWQQLTFIEVLFHHSNLRLPVQLEKWLSYIVMTPRLHGIHHSIVRRERDSNFSSGLAVWDVLHRTLKTDVPQDAIEIGVCSPHKPQELGLRRLLTIPFENQQGN